MKFIQPGDWVECDAALWQTIAEDVTSPGQMVLRRATDGHLAIRPRTRLLPAATDITGEKRNVLSDLSELQHADPKDRERAQLIAETIARVRSGDYSLEGQTIAVAIRSELASQGVSLSLRQIQRYVRAFDARGTIGLLDKRSQNQPERSRDADEAKAIINDLLRAERDKSTGTRSRLVHRLRVEAAEQGVELPSDRTLYRWINELEAGRSTFDKATTRRSKALRPDRTYRRRSVTRPGELVEIDSTPLDVMVRLPDGTNGRPELTYAIDVATRTICGTLLLPRATKSVDVAASLLGRMLTPVVDQPSWQEQLKTAYAIFGQDEFPPPEEWHALASAKPCIVPETIMMDRGKVFTGRTFRDACEFLEISQIMASPRQPTDKPHVEGGFNRIREGLIQYLAGYTGSSVELRGLNPEKDVVWSVEELQLIIDLWVLSVWQVQPQSGLKVDQLSRVSYSPNGMYQVLSGVSPQRAVHLEGADYLMLMPYVWRRVHHYGINFEGLIYDGPGLHALRGRKSLMGGEAKGRWEVRYDPFNLRALWVRGPGDVWIEAKWTLADQLSRPFSLDVLRAAGRVARQEASNSGNRVATAAQLLRSIERIQDIRNADQRACNTDKPLLSEVPSIVDEEITATPINVTSLPRLKQIH